MKVELNTAPGTYYEHTDTRTPVISPLRTDIAGFVGIAARGPLHQPVPIESWRQFTDHFGGFTGVGYLAYSVRAFFENGGQRCWVVRVSDINAAQAASVSLNNAAGELVWRIKASSPGVWGNALGVRLIETNIAQTTSIPGSLLIDELGVESVSGFARASLVRLSQPGHSSIWKVVENVNAIDSKLIWKHKEPALRFSYDSKPLDFNSRKLILVESVEYTLSVTQAGKPVAHYEHISLIPEHERYGSHLLKPSWYPAVYEPNERTIDVPHSVVIEEERERIKPDDAEKLTWNINGQDSSSGVFLNNGFDGLGTITAEDLTGERLTDHSSGGGATYKWGGVKALESVDEISMLSVPDIHIRPIKHPSKPRPKPKPDLCLLEPLPVTEDIRVEMANMELPPSFTENDIFKVQQAMVAQCEEKMDRVALLDPPWSTAHDLDVGPGAIQAWRKRFESSYALLYYPWIHVLDPLRTQASFMRVLPPSGHVAGQIANTDLTRGVHKAPANNPVAWAQDLSIQLDEQRHGVMNELGVNLLRIQPGRGLRILGARTATADIQLRFVNVRRLLIMVKDALFHSTQWVVFEPNNYTTRAKLFLALYRLMLSLWQQGALAGNAVEQAFRVKCDEENNPARERDKGKLLAEVWLAPVKPYEFVLFHVGRSDNAFEIVEVVA